MGDDGWNFLSDNLTDLLQMPECLHGAVQQLLFLFQERTQRIDAELSGRGADMPFQLLQGAAEFFPLVPVGCQVIPIPDADGLRPGGKLQKTGIGLFRQPAGMEQLRLVRLQMAAFQPFITKEVDGEREQGKQYEVSYEYFDS